MQWTDSYTHSGATGTYTLTLTVTETGYDTVNNTSDISYSLVLSVTGSGFGSYDTGGTLTIYSPVTETNIVNSTYSRRASCNSSSPLTLFSDTLSAVAHNADGTLTLTCGGSAYRTGSNPYFNQTLTLSGKQFACTAISRGLMRIKSNGEWKQAIPYIKVSEEWKRAMCYIKNGEWKLCT